MANVGCDGPFFAISHLPFAMSASAKSSVKKGGLTP
jgi:hypothetical protein